ncbi:MAG: hypothetical protein ACRC5F_05905, partial [Cetobacterium sp.]
MVSLLVESTCNQIHTERNLELNSNIKKLIQTSIEEQVYNLNRAVNIRDNRFFKEKNTDLLHAVLNTENSVKVLEDNGYSPTTIDKYEYSSYNQCEGFGIEGYAKIKKTDYVTTFKINFKGIVSDFEFFLDDNYVVFYSADNVGGKYFYNFSKLYEIKDFKVDKNMFVHIVYRFNNNCYYLKSSLYLPFVNLDSHESIFDEEYVLERVKLCNEVEEIIFKEFNEAYFYNSDRDIVKVKLTKKYYFENDGLIYFNNSDIYSKVKDSLVKEFVQLNNLNLYSYISMLGLNEFKTANGLKISSSDGVFDNLFKNRFNNTLNGGINYFNAKNLNTKRDYSVNIKDEFFSINGNFVPKDKIKGKYKFKIFNGTCSLFLCNEKGEELVQQLPIKSDVFYMCNLKFNYLRFDDMLEPYIFEVSNKEPY